LLLLLLPAPAFESCPKLGQDLTSVQWGQGCLTLSPVNNHDLSVTAVKAALLGCTLQEHGLPVPQKLAAQPTLI